MSASLSHGHFAVSAAQGLLSSAPGAALHDVGRRINSSCDNRFCCGGQLVVNGDSCGRWRCPSAGGYPLPSAEERDAFIPLLPRKGRVALWMFHNALKKLLQMPLAAGTCTCWLQAALSLRQTKGRRGGGAILQLDRSCDRRDACHVRQRSRALVTVTSVALQSDVRHVSRRSDAHMSVTIRHIPT